MWEMVDGMRRVGSGFKKGAMQGCSMAGGGEGEGVEVLGDEMDCGKALGPAGGAAAWKRNEVNAVWYTVD